MTDLNAPQAKPEKDDGAEELSAILLKYETWYQRDRENILRGYEDLKFLAEEGQWDDRARREREAQGRPCLTVSKIGQFVQQVTGDMRQMRPAIKCVPIDDAASQKVADKILPGMIRYIETRSDAQGAYFSAADSQVGAGIGHWRVLREYETHATFNQELRIAPIDDGVGVVWDSDSVLRTREDAMGCFVPVDMSRAAFEKKYPDKSADSVGTAKPFFSDWVTDDYVRVAEYWRKVPSKRLLALHVDGSIEDLTDAEDDERSAAKAAGARIESRDGFKVQYCLISASDILEGPTDWPGSYIPVIPVIGREVKIGRQVVRHGIVRPLKDLQRIENYAISTQTEVIALQPKAPFIGTQKMFEDHEDEWESANNDNLPFLQFTPDPEAPGQKPERSQPPVNSQGLAELLNYTGASMSAVTGIYPASLGAASNETSGKAIMARQREGDTGTFDYSDNFARAIRHTGRVLIDLIPHVYDTARTIRIVGEDGKIDKLEINQPALAEDGITPMVMHDLTTGAYDLVIEMGPSFATKREEARDGMQAFFQAVGPQVAQFYIDLYAKQQDWPLADKIAKRAQMLLPPNIQQAEAAESGEPMPPQMPPPPPSPEQQQQMAEQQHQQQLDVANHDLGMEKLRVEQQKINAELEKARLDHESTMAGHAASVHAAQAGASQPDPRVDQLAQAVGQLSDMVMQIAAVIQGGQGQQSAPPPPDMPPGGPPMAPPGPPGPSMSAPVPPPPGGVLLPGGSQ